jgi:hypothetical protein
MATGDGEPGWAVEDGIEKVPSELGSWLVSQPPFSLLRGPFS